MDLNLLKEIGMTDSEIKVYQALILLGETTTGPIIKKAKIASSKVYELINKLSQKGLVTTYKRNNVKYFKAVEPERLLDYIEEKKKNLEKKEKQLKKLMPALNQLYKEKQKDFEVEVFKGYKGAYNCFIEMIHELKKDEEFLVIGGGNTPSTNKRTKLFFENIHRKRSEKGITLKIIFSEARRKSYNKMSIFPNTIARYLPYGTPSTINIYKDTTILLTMSPEPAAIRIKEKNITSSYRKYFEQMWAMAKK